MNECLLTKLKGVVDNDNLPKYNTIRFSCSLPSSPIDPAFRYFYFHNGTITCVNGKTFNLVNTSGEVIQSGLTTYTNEGWNNIGLTEGETYVFELTQKYTLKGFGTRNVIGNYLTLKADDFCYSPDLVEFNVSHVTPIPVVQTVTGKFKVPNNIMTKFDVSCTLIEVDINEFIDTTTLISMGCYNSINASGSINNLSKNISMTSLYVVGTPITGDLVTLANSMVANGRTSGTFNTQCWNSAVTIDGVPYNEAVVAGGGTYYCSIVFDSSVAGGYTISYN